MSEPWVPHAYQLRASRFLLERDAAALWLSPGLGKSSVTLAAISVLMAKKFTTRVLIIAPLRVCYNVWPQEVERWSDFRHLKVAVLHGKDKQKALDSSAQICCINPEGTEWLFKHKKFRSYEFDLLVLDESQKYKTSKTKRFKLLKPLLPRFKRRWELTGSPAANSLEDLFSQVYILDQGQTFGKFITRFRERYFIPCGYMNHEWRLRPGADQEIHEAVKHLALRMSSEDYLSLPELVVNTISVDLADSPKLVYQQMQDLLIAQVKSGIETAANAAAASGKCRQIAGGAVYRDPEPGVVGPREVEHIHSSKVDALLELVDELQGTPLLVMYEFVHEMHRLRKALGGAPHIGGDTSADESRDIINQWNRGELKVLLAHPATVATGLNLQGADAHHICWFSAPWSYELYDQGIARLHRQGNKAPRVVVHHIVAKGTLDLVVLRALREKKQVQQELFEAVKQLGGV